MTEIERWRHDGEEWGYSMPAATAWKRLPIVRHIRAIRAKIAVEHWYAFGPGSIGLRSGYDDWIIFGIWHGLERPKP